MREKRSAKDSKPPSAAATGSNNREVVLIGCGVLALAIAFKAGQYTPVSTPLPTHSSNPHTPPRRTQSGMEAQPTGTDQMVALGNAVRGLRWGEALATLDAVGENARVPAQLLPMVVAAHAMASLQGAKSLGGLCSGACGAVGDTSTSKTGVDTTSAHKEFDAVVKGTLRAARGSFGQTLQRILLLQHTPVDLKAGSCDPIACLSGVRFPG
jgi:hypothetical protein